MLHLPESLDLSLQVLVDTNFINFSIKNKIDLVRKGEGG